MAISKIPLSVSTDGKPIPITASTNFVVHTTGISSTIEDNIYLYVWNNGISSTTVKFYIGSTSSPDHAFTITLAANTGITKVFGGYILTGDGSTGRSVFINTGSSSVSAFGYVNRIT